MYVYISMSMCRCPTFMMKEITRRGIDVLKTCIQLPSLLWITCSFIYVTLIYAGIFIPTLIYILPKGCIVLLGKLEFVEFSLLCQILLILL